MIEKLHSENHPWMVAPETVTVMDVLNADGDQARFVGGCVRNALMGRAVDDIDIATQLSPEVACKRLEHAGIKVVPTGLEHGTLTAVCAGMPFEITTLRRDVETYGRRATVAYTQDWSEDAQRRDFRCNAIYCSADGTLFDPVGGIDDAVKGRVIFIGDPRERIAEDYLRILRFYRFNAWYGAALDQAGHRTCLSMSGLLADLSVERVWKELKKTLDAPDPGGVLKAMQEGHVLSAIVSAPLDFRLLLSLINADRGKSREPDALLRLAALLGRDAQAMMSLLDHMKASNAEKARAERLLASDVHALGSSSGTRDVRAASYALGSEAVEGRLRLDEAHTGGDAGALIRVAQDFVVPRLPVSGRDLVKAGFERGPQLGALLQQLEQLWIESDFALDRDALLNHAQEALS